MSRLEKTFAELRAAGRKALITFTMAGDPNAASSLEILNTLAAHGADVLEIGIPFSDPMADGPVVQTAGLRALKSGMTVKGVLDIVQQFRSKNFDTPVVLMGYFNPILHYGIDEFAKDSAAYGVDGLIIVDLPPEEAQEILPKLQQNNLDLIRLITPTSDAARLDTILQGASGFLYYVSITGVTGTKTADSNAVAAHIGRIRQATDLPIAIGFGIKTPDDAARFSSIADGIVVGSALVNNIEQKQGDSDLAAIIGAQAKALKNAV